MDQLFHNYKMKWVNFLRKKINCIEVFEIFFTFVHLLFINACFIAHTSLKRNYKRPSGSRKLFLPSLFFIQLLVQYTFKASNYFCLNRVFGEFVPPFDNPFHEPVSTYLPELEPTQLVVIVVSSDIGFSIILSQPSLLNPLTD